MLTVIGNSFRGSDTSDDDTYVYGSLLFTFITFTQIRTLHLRSLLNLYEQRSHGVMVES